MQNDALIIIHHDRAIYKPIGTNVDEAKKEAAVCLEIIKGKQFEYPIYFDIEENRQLRLGRDACSEIAKTFLETVEKAGYFVGVYSSQSHLESYISEELRKCYAVWIAHYGVSKTSYNGDFGMWQKSSSGSISGINGNVDVNEYYIDYPSIIKENVLNGFSETVKKDSKSVTLTFDGVTYSGTLTEK